MFLQWWQNCLSMNAKHCQQTRLCSLQLVHAPIWFIGCCICTVGTEVFHRDRTGSKKEARELMILGMIITKSGEASLSPTCSAALVQCLRTVKKVTAGGTRTPPATSGSLTPRSTSCSGRWGGGTFWENKLLVELCKRGDLYSVGTRTNYKRT